MVAAICMKALWKLMSLVALTVEVKMVKERRRSYLNLEFVSNAFIALSRVIEMNDIYHSVKSMAMFIRR